MRQPIRFLQSTTCTLVCVAALGALLRTPYITQRSLWYDEACSWRTVTLPFSAMLESIRANVHPPLYYLVLRGWVGFYGDSVMSLRSLSVVLAVITIVAMYKCGALLAVLVREPARPRDSSDSWRARCGGFLAATLTATSGFQVHAGIEAKMYSLGTALTALSSWMLLRACTEPSPWLWVRYAWLAVLLLYTHHYALLTVGGHIAFLIMYAIWLRYGGMLESAQRIRRIVISLLLSLSLAYYPWATTLALQVAQVHEAYWIPAPSTWTMPTILVDWFMPQIGKTGQWESVVAVVAVLGTLAFVVNRGSPASLFSVCGVIGPLTLAVAFSAWTPILNARYFRFSHLSFILCAVLLVVGVRGRLLRIITAATLVAGCVMSTIMFWGRLDIPHNGGMRNAFEWIEQHDRDYTPVVVLARQHFLPAKYYGRMTREVWFAPCDVALPRYAVALVASDVISAQQAARLLENGVWVISPTEDFAPIADMQPLSVRHVHKSRFPYGPCLDIWVGYAIKNNVIRSQDFRESLHAP